MRKVLGAAFCATLAEGVTRADVALGDLAVEETVERTGDAEDKAVLTCFGVCVPCAPGPAAAIVTLGSGAADRATGAASGLEHPASMITIPHETATAFTLRMQTV